MNTQIQFIMKLIRKNIQAEFHDYSGGDCLVTVCTRNKEHYWGKIIRSSSMIPTIESKQNVRFVRPNVPGCMNLPATGRTRRASIYNILNTNIVMGGYFDAEGNAYYYLTDYQGNVTGVIDSSAKIVQETGPDGWVVTVRKYLGNLLIVQ